MNVEMILLDLSSTTSSHNYIAIFSIGDKWRAKIVSWSLEWKTNEFLITGMDNANGRPTHHVNATWNNGIPNYFRVDW